MAFFSGIGAHFEDDIKTHTPFRELEKALTKAGSAMEEVMIHVYPHGLNDYKSMNEAYKGRYGNKPPVRTTVAVYRRVLVEIYGQKQIVWPMSDTLAILHLQVES